MAVFLAVSDETYGGDVFSFYHFAGWIAPEPDWSQFFVPAWQERVLDGPPRIEYLHMTEMRSRAWREKWKITEIDMDERLDEAARVIDQSGSLYPLNITIDSSKFRPLYKDHKVKLPSGGSKVFQPDFLAFVAYAHAVLGKIHMKNPEAEKVDFVVENNSDITKYIHELYKTLPAALEYIGAPELIPLLGDFSPAGKECIPLQAADYLCWHLRRAQAQTLDDRDSRRWNTISARKGFNLPVSTSLLTGLSEAFTEKAKEDEATNTIREIRRCHAKTDKRSSQHDKGKAGRGKDRKKAQD